MAARAAAKAEKVVWAMVVLAALMALMFFVLHLASAAPVVGGASSTVAGAVSGSRYGY